MQTLSSEETQERLTSTLRIARTVTTEQSQKLLDCAKQHHQVFAVEDHEQGEVVSVKHEINTSNSPPIRQVPRCVPFAVQEAMTKMVHDMLEEGVIQESSSPGQAQWY